MESSYLIRYGLGRQVGRFASDSPDFTRGQTVVIRSHRGTELGEVLIKVVNAAESESESGSEAGHPAPAPLEAARVLRAAGPEDLERARQLEQERTWRFDLCRRVLQDRDEVLELVDVEPLLDDRRLVLHYLGPHRLDAAGLLAIFRSTCDIDVFFEPVGRDVPDDDGPSAGAPGCGHCGTGGGCGSGGGCGTGSGPSSGGCADCGIRRLLAARRS